MEQEVESLVPQSTGYFYRYKFGEPGKNANRQDGGDKTLSISILKSIKLFYYIYQRNSSR